MTDIGKVVHSKQKTDPTFVRSALAGAEGFEPSTKVLETLENTICCIRTHVTELYIVVQNNDLHYNSVSIVFLDLFFWL